MLSGKTVVFFFVLFLFLTLGNHKNQFHKCTISCGFPPFQLTGSSLLLHAASAATVLEGLVERENWLI